MKKKTRVLLIVLAAVLLLAIAGGIAYDFHLQKQEEARQTRAAKEAQAEAVHEEVYAQYQLLRQQAMDSTLTVTEAGEPVGVYSLEALGLLEAVLTEIDSRCSETDRLSPEAFAGLTYEEKLAWEQGARPSDLTVQLSAGTLDAVQSAHGRRGRAGTYADGHPGERPEKPEQPPLYWPCRKR